MTSPRTPRLDLAKLRVGLQRLGDDSVRSMLDEALDLIPKARLVKLAARYVDLKRLEPDGASRRGLFAAVEKFERASLAGEFYESFNVNSKNFMQKSNGTRAWIAECQRLLRQLVIAEGKEDPADVATALESIFRLLHHIDEGHDDVIFFADEGGSWQVGVEWRQVFPGWVRCLARIASPQEYSGLGQPTLRSHRSG